MRRSSLVLAAVVVSGVVAVSPAAGALEQTPKRGGTVFFGLDGEGCVNPICGQRVFTAKVLTPAFSIAPDLTSRPQLVSSVAITKKRPLTLTYHIRPEARWSDRVAVTARDFVFTHEAIRKALATDPDNVSDLHEIHGGVKSIGTLDPKTFRVVFRSREAGWRGLFTTVLPRHALVGEDLATVWRDGIVNPKTGRPIGNGPFLLDRWERGKQYTLVRNPNYWGPHVSYLDRIVVRFQQQSGGAAPPPEVLEGLREGRLDFAFIRDPSIVPDLQRMSGIRFFHTSQSAWEFLDIRMGPGGHPALQRKLVRRALAHGIDRAAIARRLFGVLDPTYPPSDSAVFLNASRYHQANWGRYRYRPAESRSLLERAGCKPDTEGIYVCGGRRLELRLATTAGASLRERTVKLIQAQLRRAGVEARPEFVPGSVLFSQIVPSGNFDLTSYLKFVSADGSGKKSHLGCGAAGNYGGYCQRLVTSDLDQADRILDADERARVLNQVDRQLAKDVPLIPLYEPPLVLALRNTVRNVVVSAEDLLWNAEDWWLER
jgi:peptide/nickel transport system substrate-binding protein